MFDRSKLNESDKTILDSFLRRRTFFNGYIKENKLNLHTCPGCGYPTLAERGGYNICIICNWEDDNQDDHHADEIWGAPNGVLSLTQNRINIGRNLGDENGKRLILDNVYATKILKTIKDAEANQSTIAKRITGNETLQHPIYSEWKQIETDLQKSIYQINII